MAGLYVRRVPLQGLQTTESRWSDPRRQPHRTQRRSPAEGVVVTVAAAVVATGTVVTVAEGEQRLYEERWLLSGAVNVDLVSPDCQRSRTRQYDCTRKRLRSLGFEPERLKTCNR
jgi:hypothetical protein